MHLNLSAPPHRFPPQYGVNLGKLFSLCLLLAFVFQSHSSRAEDRNSFVSEPLGISITWPEQFQRPEQVDSLSAKALLILRYKNGYPTFNIVRSSDALSADAAQEILASYRQIGFIDPKIDSRFTSPQGWQGFELVYHPSANTLFHSSVVLVPQRNSYLVLTFVDPAENFARDRPLFDRLLQSIKIRSADITPVPKDRFFPVVILLLAAAAVAVSIAVVFARRKQKTPQLPL